MTDMRIYVACLAAYNNGHLHGKWIDATQALDDIQREVKAMRSNKPHRSPMQKNTSYMIIKGLRGGKFQSINA